MTSRFYRWLRVVLPPAPWNHVMAVAWFALNGFTIAYLTFMLWVFRDMGLGRPSLDEITQDFGEGHVAAMSLLAFLYGLSRPWVFHPAANEKYRKWLALTPWTSRQPLPVGPLHLVWQDAVLVGLLAVLPTIYAWPDTCYGPMAFFIGYTVSLTILNWRTGRDPVVYATCIMAGGIILLLPIPAAALAVAAATATVALSGARQSLVDFPWEESFSQRRIPELLIYRKNRAKPATTSPDQAARRLSPYPKLGPAVRVSQAAAISVIFGWIAFTIAFHARHEVDFERGMWSVTLMLALAFATIRISRYVEWHWWPISLIGRLGTWHWLLPGYDRVFLAPLATLGAGLLPGWIAWLGLPMFIAGPLSITLALFITLAAPPSMENWHYTGRCRLSDNLSIQWGSSNSFDSSQFERQ